MIEENDKKVTPIAIATWSNAMWDPETMIRDCLSDFESGELVATSAVILLLDQSQDSNYKTNFFMSKLSLSQAIALLEYVKHGMLAQMRNVKSRGNDDQP